jgi:hypothetical protein
MALAPGITAPPSREAVEAAYQRIWPHMLDALTSAAVLSMMLPPVTVSEGARDPLPRTRAALALLDGAIQSSGSAGLPASLGLDWTAMGPAVTPEMMAGPADASALASLLDVARRYARDIAGDAVMLSARTTPTAGVVTRIATYLRGVVTAVRDDLGDAARWAMSLPPRLVQALSAWCQRTIAIAERLFGAIGGAAEGTASLVMWLVIAGLAWTLTRR